MIQIPQQLHTFGSLDELYETADTLPDAEKTGRILAVDNDREDYQQLGWRSPIYLDDQAVGDVSANDDYYHVIQYGDILDAVGTALEPHTDAITPRGYVRLSDSGHRMTSYIDFAGIDAEPQQGDVIDLGLQVQTGHTGFHGVNYDIGAERQICSNGMTAFVSDLHFDQTHSEPLQYGLAQHAVDSVIDGVDAVEHRLQDAASREFVNRDEAVLVLFDTGLDAFFDEPYDVFTEALDAELDAATSPTLYETYNAATRAVTHGGDLTGTDRDRALRQAATLLDRRGQLPETADLGQTAVERRIDQYTVDDDDAEPYWSDEEQTLQDLVAAHGTDSAM